MSASAGGRWATAVHWVVSGAATLVSTYVLDLVATVCGLVLVASAVLDGLGTTALWWVLVASYGGWALGLRVNLRANLALLDRSGISTNVLSKAAYDVAARRSARRGIQRFAAASGYLLSELLKELPYYVGAFGAAAVSEEVHSGQAVVFLVGANLGAGLYELGLAGATRGALRRRGHADFERDWDPAAYLREYYGDVQPDEVATISFLVDALAGVPRGRPVLFYGVGPTLHHVFAAAPIASELHLGEFLAQNRAEVTRWLERDPRAHDWRPFVRHTLRCEGETSPADAEVGAREELTRAKVTRVLAVDARHPPTDPDQYAVVVSAYCADSATSDRAEWVAFMHAIMAHVEPGGLFVVAALHHCHDYTVGGRAFPSADVGEDDLRRVLDDPWGPGSAKVRVHHLVDQPDHGYAGILLATAVHAPVHPLGAPSRPAASTVPLTGGLAARPPR